MWVEDWVIEVNLLIIHGVWTVHFCPKSGGMGTGGGTWGRRCRVIYRGHRDGKCDIELGFGTTVGTGRG